MVARRGQEPEHGRQAGQREDVESDVAGEDRVGDPERRPVDHSEHQVPGPVATKPASSAQNQRDRKTQTAQRRS